MIVGAQKCATTTLFSLLEQHPGMQGPKYKETNFFSYAMDWRAELPRYMKLYPDAPGKVLFEASPSYTLPSRVDMGDPTSYSKRINPLREGSFRPTPKEAVWEDIHAYNPAMKLIYLVRHPLERIVSGYMHYYLRGYTDLPLVEELRTNSLHLEITRYATRIRPYIERFGREQVLILDFEEMTRQEPALLERIANFIGVDPKGFENAGKQRMNVTVGHALPVKWDLPALPWIALRKVAPKLWYWWAKRDMRILPERPVLPKELAEEILYELEPEIKGIEQMLGKELPHWRSMPGRSRPKTGNDATG